MYGYNYYNPFMYQTLRPRGLGLFKSIGNGKNIGNLLHKINFSSILTGTSKTLNVINQAIPIYYQVKPMFKNAKTMFKIVNAIKTDDNRSNINNYQNNNTVKENNKIYNNPVFFI